ncbi:MAG TPA: hypothetical protein VJ908_03280 [Wenzhouxiangellaceae bacterium]|nr:hypothetical protein [Wenzhouxiangellaceae bacterium]
MSFEKPKAWHEEHEGGHEGHEETIKMITKKHFSGFSSCPSCLLRALRDPLFTFFGSAPTMEQLQ